MEKFRRPQFFEQPLSYYRHSKLSISEMEDRGRMMYFKGPVSFSSIDSQLGLHLHRMMSSVVGLLTACSDIFFLLAHLFRILYEIVASALSFALSACHVIWFILIYSLVIVVNTWDFLFVTPGLVYIVLNIGAAVLRGILLIILYLLLLSVFFLIVSVAYHLRVAEFKHNNH